MTQITIYSSNYCGSCQMVKAFLSLRNAEFVEKNVSKDLEARAELIALGYDSTPITLIGDRSLEGFNTAALDDALAALGSG